MGAIVKSKQIFVLVQILGFVLLFSIAQFIMSFSPDLPYKIVVSLILGVLAYGIYSYCCIPNSRIDLKVKFFGTGLTFSLMVIYVLALVIVQIPTMSSYSLFYVEWSSLGLLDVAKLFSSILLSSFLPGYALLKMILYGSRETVFSKIGLGVLSILLSFVVTSLVTLSYWIVRSDIRGVELFLSASYFALFALWIIVSLIDRNRSKENKMQNSNYCMVSLRTVFKILILLSIAAYLFWAFQASHFMPQTLPIIGDELDHSGLTRQFLIGWYSWPQVATKVIGYPYFFHLNLGATASIANLPFANVYNSFFFVLILPAFAFYFMAKMIFDSEEYVPLMATVIFSVFSGFGWFFYDSTLAGSAGILQASQRTYDIIYSTWFPLYIAPYAIDSSIFFVLISLMCHKNLHIRVLFILSALLTAFGVFSHVEMMLVFSFLLLFLSILQIFNVAKFTYHLRAMLASYLMGVLIFFALNLVAQYSLDSRQFSMILDGFCISAVSLIVLESSEMIKKRISRKSFGFNTRALKNLFPFIILSLYFILFIDFFYSFSSYNFGVASVPFWFLPLKFGVAGLLSLVGIFYSFRKGAKGVDFFIALFAGTLFMQLLLYHLNFSEISIDFQEFRVIRDILWPFLSIVAAYGFARLLSVFKQQFSPDRNLLKYSILLLLFFVIFASAVPSNLLKVAYFSSSQRIMSNEEIAGLEFLGTLNVSTGSNILAGLSKQVVYAITGVQAYGLDTPVYSQLIFNSKSPGTVLYVLHYLNISYICLSLEDMRFITSKYSDSYFTWLLPHLPIVYKNSAITIYELPSFSPPVDKSNTAVLTGDLLTYSEALTENPLWMETNFMQGWRNVTTVGVVYSNFTSVHGVLTIEAKTLPNQQAAVFYVRNFETPISVNNNTLAVLRFRSETNVSYAILDAIYSDGSSQRLAVQNTGYMNSLDWTTVTNNLQSNKSLITLRIGITDNSKGAGTVIGVSVEYLAIAQAEDLVDYYGPSLMAASMGINFTTVSEFDISRFNFSQILMSDTTLPDEMAAQYVEWVNNGGNLIVWINSQKSGTFSTLLGINATGRYLKANSFAGECASNESLVLQELTVPELQLSNRSTLIIAEYSLENTSISPLIVQEDIGKGKILCVEATPLLGNSCSNQDFFEAMTWISKILQNPANLTSFHFEDFERIFYTKNIGSITLQGNTRIDTSSLVFGLTKLDGVRMSFSNYTDVENGGMMIQNATLSHVDFGGAVSAGIQIVGKVTVVPLDSDSYLLLKLGGKTSIGFDLNNDTAVNISLANGNNTSESFQNGFLSLDIMSGDIGLIARKPTVISNGTTTFNSLFTSYSSSFQSNGNRATSNGTIEFKMKLSEAKVLLIEAKFIGEMKIDVSSQPATQEDLNFFSNLSSRSVLSILVIILIDVVIFIKTQKRNSLKVTEN